MNIDIDFKLIPNINKNQWNCHNCNNSLDLIWILKDLIEECESNEEYKEHLYNSKTFDHQECDCCYHSICFDEIETQELISLVKKNLKA